MRTMKPVITADKGLEDRYVRRVQVTGRGSYIVSIPKHWVESAGLKKGGRVEFSKQQNSGLLLIPFESVRGDQERASCELSVAPDADPDAVTRKIISLYVVGYSTIDISSKAGNLGAPIRDAIRDVARQKLVGTEMVMESARSATLQVLLNYPQLLVPDALRRMGSIMSSMQQDAMQALIAGDKDLAAQVIKIDDEIDRFSLYIIRQLKWAVQHLPLLERIGLNSPVECLGYRIITKSVERSADHACRVAKNSLALNHPLEPAVTKETNALAQFSYKVMESALHALFSHDYELAEKTLLEKDRMAVLESKLLERLVKERLPAADLSATTLISDSLRRIGEYASDVAEVVLNLTVEEATQQSAKKQ
ncbi:MAG: PhoU domain-containing protein [Candidatus Bathyarchaeia archaeon]